VHVKVEKKWSAEDAQIEKVKKIGLEGEEE
jgi:hypothetical protein